MLRSSCEDSKFVCCLKSCRGIYRTAGQQRWRPPEHNGLLVIRPCIPRFCRQRAPHWRARAALSVLALSIEMA